MLLFKDLTHFYVQDGLRMHLKENGTVRNRGTGFRMREKDMLELYGNKRKLL